MKTRPLVFLGASALLVAGCASVAPNAIPPEQITSQARVDRAAAAAGVDLSGIHSISVQPPMAIYTGPGPGASYWQVQVKVTYDIKP